jgi:hypothetical protein
MDISRREKELRGKLALTGLNQPTSHCSAD